MRLLIFNDDGMYSAGIAALAEVAIELGEADHEIRAAPRELLF